MEEKKEIKIRLSTVIYLLIIVTLVVTLGVTYYFGFVANKNEIVEDKKVTNNTENVVSNTNIKNEVETSKYVWEKYPSDLKKKVIYTVLGEGDFDVDGELPQLYVAKTMYSLINKYPENEYENCPFSSWITDYLIYGDSTEILACESNYYLYSYDNENKSTLNRYVKPITYKIATFNELYDISVNTSEYDKELTIEERTASQYADLMSGKKDYHYDIPKDRNFYYEIPAMLVMNGNNTSEEDYKNNARAKKIKVTINEDKEYIFDLKDTNAVQVFDIDYKRNTIENPVSIEVEVIETYAGDRTEDVYISDIRFSIESNIPQGR